MLEWEQRQPLLVKLNDLIMAVLLTLSTILIVVFNSKIIHTCSLVED